MRVNTKRADPKIWEQKFDLVWIIIPANLACALFSLGWFESVMWWANFICLIIMAAAMFYTIYRNKAKPFITSPINKSILVAIINPVIMCFAGWYWLAGGFFTLLFSQLLMRKRNS